MADEKKKVAPSYFTVEEANLICIYNKKDRQVAMVLFSTLNDASFFTLNGAISA